MPFNPLTTTQAAEQLGISRQAFVQSVLPLMIERGDAVPFGASWAIDGKSFWMWQVYAEVRRSLIADVGQPAWSITRAWSIADMEAIALDDQYPDHGAQ